MKFALRVFTMMIVFAGMVAVSMAPANAMSATHKAWMPYPGPLNMPIPGCGPGVPSCPQNPPPGGGLR